MIALDILRTMHKEPLAVTALLGELGSVKGKDARYDALLAALQEQLRTPAEPRELQRRARVLVDQMGLAVQAAALLADGPPEIAEAYCASRLPARSPAGWNYGATAADHGSPAAEQLLLDRLHPAHG